MNGGMFRKKPVVIEAYQHSGSSTSKHALHCWMTDGKPPPDGGIHTRDIVSFQIETLEGSMTVSPGDWVIKDVQGEFYPCKPDIFAATYDKLRERRGDSE